jgi:hypothetical protein
MGPPPLDGMSIVGEVSLGIAGGLSFDLYEVATEFVLLERQVDGMHHGLAHVSNPRRIAFAHACA